MGVASYDVQVSIAGGAFKPVYSGPKTSVTAFYPFRKNLVWRVRATDKNDNVSGWVNSAKRSLASIQNSNHSIHYRGPWTGVRMPAASGQGFSYGSSTSSNAGVTFNGRGILYVAPKNKVSGFVKVYVDGALIGRYKLTNAKFLNGRIIARFAWAANGHHRIPHRQCQDRDAREPRRVHRAQVAHPPPRRSRRRRHRRRRRRVRR